MNSCKLVKKPLKSSAKYFCFLKLKINSNFISQSKLAKFHNYTFTMLHKHTLAYMNSFNSNETLEFLRMKFIDRNKLKSELNFELTYELLK